MPPSDVEELQNVLLEEMPHISSKRISWLRNNWPELLNASLRFLDRDIQPTGAPSKSRRQQMLRMLLDEVVECISPGGHKWARTQCLHCDLHTWGRRDTIRDIDLLRVRDHTTWCFYCGDYGDTVDHVIPTFRDGPDTLDNKVIACQRCNGEKGHQLNSEWVDRWYLRGDDDRTEPVRETGLGEADTPAEAA